MKQTDLEDKLHFMAMDIEEIKLNVKQIYDTIELLSDLYLTNPDIVTSGDVLEAVNSLRAKVDSIHQDIQRYPNG